ncbi:hypothetical protein [Phnomibacter sp. MR]|uniref:hypothetical protein n=1 Tax=Phnomibacter sp. MR TaxID=3042318 RepID=UPI003A7FA9E6
MKKGIIVVSVLLVVLVLLLQFVWTAPKNVTTQASFKVSAAAANRMLGDTAIWQKIQTASATANAVVMKPVMASMGQVMLRVKSDAIDTLSQILLVELGNDSVILNWETPLPASNWFWQHWQQRNHAAALQAAQQRLATQLKAYLENTQQAYGFNIVKGQMTDSIVVTKSFETASRPDLPMIYAQLAELEKFANANGAGFTNPPMLFVQTDGQSYRTQVALPVNKWLPEHPVYKTKRMVLGNNLTAEVTGGQQQIRACFAAMYQHVADYNRMMPGIPYEMLLNNRLSTDSSAWQTRVYFPIME